MSRQPTNVEKVPTQQLLTTSVRVDWDLGSWTPC